LLLPTELQHIINLHSNVLSTTYIQTLWQLNCVSNSEAEIRKKQCISRIASPSNKTSEQIQLLPTKWT